MRDLPPPDDATLERLGARGATLTVLETGHINKSWLARLANGEQRVVQALNPIFPPTINRDIDVVTRRLAENGLVTPRLVPAADGALWIVAGDVIWRQLTFVPGRTFERVPDAAHAREAGALLGRFHAALVDFEHVFENARLGVHDLARHVSNLQTALKAHADHAAYAAVAPVAGSILELCAELDSLPSNPDRNVHGDPKISNIVFDEDYGRAICLIDLDTLARMPIALELGDALRSWCNAADEDAPDASFDETLYAAAIEGYATSASAFVTATEWRAIPSATLRIAAELAARFCADALEERYFGWDRARYATASAHNLARASAQLALARTIAACLPTLEHTTARTFAR